MLMLTDATKVLRIEPREWMRIHAKQGARVTIAIHSEWALPPIFDMGFDTGYRFLEIPYKDPAALEKYEPPELESLMNQTDFIVLNDVHASMYLLQMRRLGFDTLASRWEHFLDDIANHFRVVEFSSQTDSYGIRAIRIVIVNHEGLRMSD
jgi:hypothetical protein